MTSRRERGNALVIVLILMIPLAAIAAAALSFGSRESGELGSQRGRQVALLNAESGLDTGFAQLLDDPKDTAPIEMSEPNGEGMKYRVEFTELGVDGIDNDGDGAVDESDENRMVRITSMGTLNVDSFTEGGEPVAKQGVEEYVKTVRAVGTRSADLPGFPYAVYLGDPKAELNMNGNAFAINGSDFTGALKAGTAPAVPGIATTGKTADIITQLSKQQYDNVLGKGGYPSVYNTAKVDIQSLINTYKSAADIKFVNPSSPYTGNLGSYSKHDFKITHVVGNLKISGGGEGAGLLLVEGNVEITGGWEYRGVVLVTGQVVFKGGGGGKRVVGSVLVGGDLINGASSTDLEMAGTVDVLYSSSIQSEVSAAIGKFTLGTWQEL